MIQPVRSIGIAASLILASTGIASAQRGGLPRLVAAPAPAPMPAAPAATGRGMVAVPRAAGPTAPVGGGLPRLVTRPGGGYGRGYAMGSGGFRGGFSNGANGSHRWQPGYTRGVGSACVGGCWGGGTRFKHFYGSYIVGYPFWTVPYVYDYYGSTYVDSAAESYAPEPAGRTAPKLIVIGAGSAGSGDALTVETMGDSVRLSWLAAGRPAREVKLFVADSARRELATRSASPSTPTAVFEVATLSSPVAFAGVTVTFADGVVTTTMVPYRQQR